MAAGSDWKGAIVRSDCNVPTLRMALVATTPKCSARVTRWVSEKNRPNVAQPIFCQNQCINLSVKKTTSVVFNKLSKVNNHPMGENSPNLVTLCSVCIEQKGWYKLNSNYVWVRNRWILAGFKKALNTYFETSSTETGIVACEQGDQIGQFYACWPIGNLGSFLKITQILDLFFSMVSAVY
jgi:hypothetical protein